MRCSIHVPGDCPHSLVLIWARSSTLTPAAAIVTDRPWPSVAAWAWTSPWPEVAGLPTQDRLLLSILESPVPPLFMMRKPFRLSFSAIWPPLRWLLLQAEHVAGRPWATFSILCAACCVVWQQVGIYGLLVQWAGWQVCGWHYSVPVSDFLPLCAAWVSFYLIFLSPWATTGIKVGRTKDCGPLCTWLASNTVELAGHDGQGMRAEELTLSAADGGFGWPSQSTAEELSELG